MDVYNMVPIFNISENQIPDHFISVYDVLNFPRGDKTVLLKDVELVIDSNRRNLEINRRTGDIIVKITFDREEICPSKLSDECMLDYVLSYRSIFKEFKVLIRDKNDNSPIFKDKMKEIEIREGDSEKMDYLLPKATDADTMGFGIEKYTIKFYDEDKSVDFFNEYFRLINMRAKDKSISPVLKIVKLLDREKVEKFMFTLIAWDKDQKSGDCKIMINVIDVNDNAPIWTPEPYNVQIKECTSSKEVQKLEATDKDDPNTDNGRITYEIGEKTRTNNQISNIFHVSGNFLYVDLSKLQDLDVYEFEVEVIAKDGGGRSSAKNVNVKILHCNRNKPQIEIKNRNPKIRENEKKSVKLSNVVVTDPDRGMNGEFDCTIDDSYRFSLATVMPRNEQQRKYVIYTLNTIEGVDFDREKVSAISITITCTDRGIPAQTSTQTLIVQVSDVNDNKPTFSKSIYTFTVEENIQIGAVIGTVRALDLDSNENGRVVYEIESSTKETFSVNNKGYILTNVELDREKINSYEFKVFAKDNGKKPLESSCIVKVFVSDVNDCRPEVEKQFVFEIVESRGFAQIHLNLGKIEAKDADIGLNGTLNFKIANSNPRDFGKSLLQITSDGHLSIFGNVDRETMKSINFEIVVFDNGKPSLSTMTTVIINILDVNDNKPKFIFPNYPNHNFINISLQSSIGSVLAVIEATDPDNGSNGTVTFNLMGGEHIKSFFELHQSGQLILIKPLGDRRLNPDRLLIQAIDGGDPPMSEITTLYLRYFNNKKVSVSKTLFEKKSVNSDGKHDKDQLKDSANVNLLYGLAAVLFIIFFVALIALFFIYAKGRAHMTQDFAADKNARGRKNYFQKVPVSSNELKRSDDLLDSSLCDTNDTNINQTENYTHLMFFKDPNYNLLYPRMMSKSEIDNQHDNISTVNYFHHQNQPDISGGGTSMRMLVNNLSPQTTKSQSLSNPLLMYKDSVESLNESSYNSPCVTNRDRVVAGLKDDDHGTMVPSNQSGYTQSYITSTFV